MKVSKFLYCDKHILCIKVNKSEQHLSDAVATFFTGTFDEATFGRGVYRRERKERKLVREDDVEEEVPPKVEQV